jgi:hypothetical protein
MTSTTSQQQQGPRRRMHHASSAPCAASTQRKWRLLGLWGWGVAQPFNACAWCVLVYQVTTLVLTEMPL